MHRFVIPGGLLPSSVDPLEIDAFNNYFPSQMIYISPLQVSLDGKLESKILSAFSYDEQSSVISLKIGKWTYSDGSSVTLRDVALTVKRMVLKRPNFPVIRYIAGLDSWLTQKVPLLSDPSGMKIQGDTLTIALTQKVYHPLFRLSLNVFSVIPERCVDLEKNVLACERPPSSGYYVQEKPVEKTILFTLRQDLPKDVADALPPRIQFSYENAPVAKILADTNNDSVIWAYDLNFSPQEHDDMKKAFKIERLPAAWFTGFVLNPRVGAFDDADCRYWFAQTFRETFASQTLGPVDPSASIFTKLIPGHKANSTLAESRKLLSRLAAEKCVAALKKQDFVYAIRSQTPPPLVENALRKMSEKYGFKIVAPVIAPASHSGWPSYKRSGVALQLTNSGFWPLDPVGDAQMLLSQNLHEDYMDISSDKAIQGVLSDISKSYSFADINKNMGRLNQSLYDTALFNVFSNQSYFFISRRDRPARKGATFSVTLPYPWQVF